jgi:hypothetical protein
MSVSYGKGPKGKATRLHAQIVRARGACEKCGDTYRLETAHIISRRYSATRTLEANAFCLCCRCHRRFHEHVDEWMGFINETIGWDEYQRLKDLALGNRAPWPQSRWQDEADRLALVLKTLEADR